MPQFHAPDYADNTADEKIMCNILADMLASGDAHFEEQLNQSVNQAYGLGAEDIAVIESHLEGK